jgi:hypothetical protein
MAVLQHSLTPSLVSRHQDRWSSPADPRVADAKEFFRLEAARCRLPRGTFPD